MVLVAVLAVIFRILNYPLAPLLLGFILGGMLEDNLRRALLIWDGSFAFLLQRPITLTIVIVTLLTLCVPFISTVRDSRRVGRTDSVSD